MSIWSDAMVHIALPTIQNDLAVEIADYNKYSFIAPQSPTAFFQSPGAPPLSDEPIWLAGDYSSMPIGQENHQLHIDINTFAMAVETLYSHNYLDNNDINTALNVWGQMQSILQESNLYLYAFEAQLQNYDLTQNIPSGTL